MGNETWFVQIEVMGGNLEGQLPTWYKGPVIRIGRDPGPDGISLTQFRGVAAHHATITAYDGQSVQMTSIGAHIVRVANHINEDWSQVQPINGNVYLNDGDIIHLGSLTRGCRLRFITCKPLEWRESRLVALNENSEQELAYHDFKPVQVSTRGGIPKWFIPTILAAAVAAIFSVVGIVLDKQRDPIAAFGPIFEEYDHYKIIDIYKKPERPILNGYKEPFRAFVMTPNAEASGFTGLDDEFEEWDQIFYWATINTIQEIAKSRGFWEDLERAKDEYALVVSNLRQMDLPTVFAAIPYQETRYRRKLVSPVCAAGIWQFMPETAHRMELAVEKCTITGQSKLWTPTKKAPPFRVSRDSVYYNKETQSCKIKSCKVDERSDVQASTLAAMGLLEDTWVATEAADSGSAVQMTILAHNAGWDDSPYLGREKFTNILPAYRRYMKKNAAYSDGVRFYGDSIKCDPKKLSPYSQEHTNERCQSEIVNQTQHYGYKVVAQHILAVCYYAKTYGNNPAFKDWKPYVAEGGYCNMINQINDQ